jgi:hypothetical protein
MKKLFLVVFALLLLAGVANATNIPTVTDPKNYPMVWTEIVYNGSGSTIYSGYVVDWDFDTCDSDAGSMFDDMGSWVKVNSTADSIWTAGVLPIGKNLANGDIGRIVVKGPVPVFMGAAAQCTVNTVVSGSSGKALDEASNATDEKVLGICIKASAAGNDIGGEVYADSALIYVEPTIYENGT